MYGYQIPYGYRGLVAGRWMTFANEAEYCEYVNELAAQANEYSEQSEGHPYK